MVCMETLYRDKPDGKKEYFYPEEVDVERDDKGRVTRATAKKDGQPVTIGRVEKMSKSKRNTVDPQQLIDTYGADTARLFVLSNQPPELDVQWSEEGVRGSNRFLKRVWVLAQANRELLAKTAAYAGTAAEAQGADQAVVRKVHWAVKRATDAMERDFGFHTAISACMELANELKPEALSPAVFKFGVSTLLRLLAPMAPHIAAELWNEIGGQGDITAAGWPSYDERQMLTDDAEYPVQVNGKMRGKIALPRTLAGAELDAAVRAHGEFQAIVGDKPIRKLIVVPGKIVNVVVG
jgi:leucyl-tRNA synthetase